MAKINLGDRVKDKISGLRGIVTGVSEFLYGCRRVTIQPEEHKDGKPSEGFWIDEPQAMLVKPGVVEAFTPKVATARRAGPRPDAQRRPDVRR